MARSDTPAFYCLGTDITLQKVEFLHFYNSATLPSRKIKLKTFQILLPRPDTTPSLLSLSLNISWMLTNREEYLANGLWLTLVTVLVTESHSLQSDTDVSRNTRSVLVPGPGHNYPHSQDRGKPRSALCIFYISAPCHFYKALPDDSWGLADWNLRLNSFLSNPSWFTARLWASSEWFCLMVSCDITRWILFDRKGLAAFKIQLPIDPVPPARLGSSAV